MLLFNSCSLIIKTDIAENKPTRSIWESVLLLLFELLIGNQIYLDNSIWNYRKNNKPETKEVSIWNYRKNNKSETKEVSTKQSEITVSYTIYIQFETKQTV
jgi:hypothetical protein